MPAVGRALRHRKAGIHNPPLTYWKGEIFVEPRTAKKLYALDAKTGKILWTYPTPVAIANPNIHAGILYTMSLSGKLLLLNPVTGKKLFSEQLSFGGVGPTELLLTRNTLIFGTTKGWLISMPYPKEKP